jgi:two-component system, LytTR family, sensor kinase
MNAGFFEKRIPPGFKIGELLLWLLFYISWPLMLTLIYHLTNKFNDPAFMSFTQFASIQAFVLTGKGLFLLPFWWLYFVKLKGASLSKKIMLHFITALLYIVLCISFFYVALVHILHVPYPPNSRIADIYNLTLIYVSYFALFHAYNFWLHTKEQIKKERALKELAYQSEIKALKSQIEPHFLFNTLNSISASVPAEMEKTRVMIAQLADTFRHALQANEKQFVTLEEEIDFLRNWLSLEKHRFHNRLAVHFDVDEKVMQTQIPPMILQPLVENALNHGIAPKINGGSVTIECRQQDDHAVISVSDTGIGYKAELNNMFTEGIGLSNVYKRLQLLYNQTLHVERNPEGLRLSFKVPLHS